MKTIRRKVPSGSAHGSGRLGAGICSWGKGTESKLQQQSVAVRQPGAQRQYVALRNHRPLACAGGGWRRRLPARRDGAHGEKAGENCSTGDTAQNLCGNPRRPLRIRLRI